MGLHIVYIRKTCELKTNHLSYADATRRVIPGNFVNEEESGPRLEDQVINFLNSKMIPIDQIQVSARWNQKPHQRAQGLHQQKTI